ncbi:Protein of unknown function DUF1963 like protein [Aduncisulcus paluster]|uniref:DUF1963 domain-containing protein n=1 Tax=Aduncisulcus paluster TaxID=2918883 RepID=A0ABQ5KJH9_9EUKA|nr:Protein of unknown function DUF1963 like protein [Aduncisulcus paluster]
MNNTEHQERVAAVLPKFAPLARPMYKIKSEPRAETPDCPSEDLKVSKFGGIPFMPRADWPKCAHCSQPLELLVQLDLSKIPRKTLPEDMPETGLLQLFFCPNTDAECVCDMDEDKWTVGRYISAEELTREPVFREMPESEVDHIPCHAITGFEETTEYPMPEECEEHLDELEEEVTPDEIMLVCDCAASESDKLGGWPCWLDEIIYPECPVCGSEMPHLMTVGSEEGLEWAFSDGGCGRIFVCPHHLEATTLSFDS